MSEITSTDKKKLRGKILVQADQINVFSFIFFATMVVATAFAGLLYDAIQKQYIALACFWSALLSPSVLVLFALLDKLTEQSKKFNQDKKQLERLELIEEITQELRKESEQKSIG